MFQGLELRGVGLRVYELTVYGLRLPRLPTCPCLCHFIPEAGLKISKMVIWEVE